jgi:adiponectin receptor
LFLFLEKNCAKFQIKQAVLKAKSRGLIHLEDLPEPWKINPHILEGYRFTDSISLCLKSAFQYSNESFNIWSHLLPLLAIIFVTTNLSYTVSISELNETIDNWIQLGYIFAVAACLACSTSWHTMKCVSHESLMWKFASLDMMGVSMLISATSVVTEYTGFYCNLRKRLLYISITCFSGLTCMILPWREWVRRPSAAWIRVTLFVLLGASGLVPAIDMALSQGLQHAIENYKPVVLKVVFPVFCGAIVYASKFPERWWPGRFDLIGYSHNLWHLGVVFCMWGGF